MYYLQNDYDPCKCWRKNMSRLTPTLTIVLVQEYLAGDNFEAKMPPRLRNKMGSPEFYKSCEIWFTDLDKVNI